MEHAQFIRASEIQDQLIYLRGQQSIWQEADGFMPAGNFIPIVLVSTKRNGTGALQPSADFIDFAWLKDGALDMIQSAISLLEKEFKEL